MPNQRKARSDKSRREANRLWQLGDYWLGREANSELIYYYWYDAGSRRTRRKITGCRDLDAAKDFLVKLHLTEPPDQPQHPETVALATVRRFYFEHHARNIRSVAAARRAFELVN